MKAGSGTSRHDLIGGPIAATLLAFALPTLASNALQSLNGSINAVWVGQLIGETGLAATSNANLILFMVYSLIFGFGMATTILVGQNMGRGDIDAVRRTVGAGLGMFLTTGVFFAWGSWTGMPALLRVLATPPEAFPLALDYARITFLTLPAGLLLIYLQLALRGTGDAITPLLFLIPSIVIDVGLNPVLILGMGPFPAMGIAGSALAGLIATHVSLVLMITYIYARDLPLRLRGRELRYLIPDRHILSLILAKGVPMGLQMIVTSFSALAMLGLVNREGTSTVAAYGATSQLWTYIQMPAMAIGAAVSTMAAQNIGAGRWDRIDKIAGAGVLMNLALTGALVVATTLPDRWVLGFFLGSDMHAIGIGQHINLMASWSFILFGIIMVLAAVPRANGATIAPLIIMTIALIPGRLGFAYALWPTLGSDAIWWSFPAGFAIAAVLTILYYRYGKWRELRLLPPAPPIALEEMTQAELEPAGRSHSAV